MCFFHVYEHKSKPWFRELKNNNCIIIATVNLTNINNWIPLLKHNTIHPKHMIVESITIKYYISKQQCCTSWVCKDSYRVCLVNSWTTLVIFSASEVLQVVSKAGKEDFWVNLSLQPRVHQVSEASCIRHRTLKGVLGVSHDFRPHEEDFDGRWCQPNTLTETQTKHPDVNTAETTNIHKFTNVVCL